MPWSPNDADPVARKRRELEEAQRLISEQVSRLTEELHQSVDPAVLEKKPIEHPVWRMEDDHHIRPAHRTRLGPQAQPSPASASAT